MPSTFPVTYDGSVIITVDESLNATAVSLDATPIVLALGPTKGDKGDTGATGTPGEGDMQKSVYDVNNDGYVDKAAALSTTGNAHQFWKNGNVWAQVDVSDLTGAASGFTPVAHAGTHKAAGSDPIKLDEFAAPTDTTALNASTSAHGLLRKLDGVSSHVLQGDGTWGTPVGAGDMLKSDYDPNGDFIVEHAVLADVAPWSGITGKPVRYLPPGTVIPYAGGTAPPGFLLADGSSYPTATYPDLFGAIGYVYGGSGSNFNVPDMRGRTAVGAGAGTGLTARTLGGIAGEEAHALTSPELATHTHTASQADHYHTIPGAGAHTHSATIPDHYFTIPASGAHSHTATLADHQHGIPPSGNHTHSDSGHAHVVINPYGVTIGVTGGSSQIYYPSGGIASQNASANLSASGNIGPTATYLTSQAYGIPAVTVAASGNIGPARTNNLSAVGALPVFTTASSGNITPQTASESSTMGAIGAVTVNSAGSGNEHNNIQPSLFLNYLIST